MEKLRIISRNSELALTQSSIVKDQIIKILPDVKVEIIGITTQGDKILDKTLDKIGGKGLFIKELQQKLLDNEADLAVHSLKDLPSQSFPDFIIPAVLKRIDATDAFVSNTYNQLSEMPCGSTIGTSSARRTAILRHYYPHLEIKLLRGNIQTRLNKLDNGEYDGIILAASGLKRLNLDSRIKESLDANKFIPAIGQGALAIEILSNRLDLMLLLSSLDDNDTFIATESEREVGRLLGADCSVPIGAYAKILNNGELELSAIVANNDDGKFLTVSVRGNKANYLCIAKSVVKMFKDKGVESILGKTISSKVSLNNEYFV